MVSVSGFLWHFCWSFLNCTSYLEILRTFFEAYHWFYPVSFQQALRILIWVFCLLTVLGTDIFTLNHLCMRDCKILKFLSGTSLLTEFVFRLILCSVPCVVFLRMAALMGCLGGYRLFVQLSCHAQWHDKSVLVHEHVPVCTLKHSTESQEITLLSECLLRGSCLWSLSGMGPWMHESATP